MIARLLQTVDEDVPVSSREAIETAIDRAKGDRAATWEKVIKRSPGPVPQWDSAEPKPSEPE